MIDAIDELERLHKASTPGPWRVGSVEKYHVFCPHDAGLAGPGGERVLLRMNEHFAHDVDAAAIVAAHNHLPSLLATLREMREALAFYADQASWCDGFKENLLANNCDECEHEHPDRGSSPFMPDALDDEGRRARAALERARERLGAK